MNIAVGCDHAGFLLAKELIPWLEFQGHKVQNLGTHSCNAVDYPDFARAVGNAVAQNSVERGLMICGSGVGASVAANKVKGVRASVCHDTFSARQGVEDDDLNTLCLGARVIGAELAKEVVTAFLTARFSHLDRHERRLRKVLEIEIKGS